MPDSADVSRRFREPTIPPTAPLALPVKSDARILMIPVSSPSGIGEYMRCLILADALKARWPALDLRFLLSREAPVAATCPYPAELLACSATLAGAAVERCLEVLRPDLVIFDCAGRARHARAARRLGARVIYVSQHRRKRARGFAWGRLIALDAHWITQFRFIDGDLGPLERLKLHVLRKPAPHFLGPVHADPAPELPAEFADYRDRPYSLWAAGGGGHRNGTHSATECFHAAAAEFGSPERPVLLVAGANYSGPPLPDGAGLRVVRSLPHATLMTLVAQARLVVCGGGDLMGQALALGRNVLAVAVAKDQPPRIAACVARGLVRTASLDIPALAAAAQVAHTTPLAPVVEERDGLRRAVDEVGRLLALSRA